MNPALRVGDVAIARVEELRIPNTIAHFTQDRALIEANRHWLAPHFLDDADGFDLVFQSWIFVADGRVVLVDPCTGNGKPHVVPFFDRLEVPFLERMETSGFRPEDVDFVVCTHLHHDHCGWNTRLRDGKWVPTFANARYIFQQAEYDRWGPLRHLHPPFPYNDGVFERSVAPVVEAGLVDLVSGTRRLTPGIEVITAPGHTVGHQMLHLQAGTGSAYFTGDCFHHPIQLVAPEIPFGDSENMAETIAIRRRLGELSAAEGALLIAAHLPEPHGVIATHRDGAIAWRAASRI